MYCASFIFTPGDYDEDFHRLNNAIDTYVKNLTGFSHSQSWYSEDKKTVNATYYFKDEITIQKLADLPAHVKAKAQVDRWYQDYRVEVLKLVDSYGKADR